MKTSIKTLAIMTLLVGMSGVIYAARPPWADNSLTKEERRAARGEYRYMGDSTVMHMYMYEDTEAESYDYGSDPWGNLLIHNKRQTVMVNAHGLTPETEYTLYIGETLVGRGVAVGHGNVHIMAPVPSEVEEGDWTLRSSDGSEIFLTALETRISPMPGEEETE